MAPGLPLPCATPPSGRHQTPSCPTRHSRPAERHSAHWCEPIRPRSIGESRHEVQMVEQGTRITVRKMDQITNIPDHVAEGVKVAILVHRARWRRFRQRCRHGANANLVHTRTHLAVGFQQKTCNKLLKKRGTNVLSRILANIRKCFRNSINSRETNAPS